MSLPLGLSRLWRELVGLSAAALGVLWITSLASAAWCLGHLGRRRGEAPPARSIATQGWDR